MTRQRIAFLTPSRVAGCEFYRAVLPYRHCVRRLASFGLDVELTDRIDPESGPLAGVVAFRHAWNGDALSHLLARQAAGAKVAYDLDDDLLAVPEWSPVEITQRDRDKILAMRSACDAFWASTDHLGRIYSQPNFRAPEPTVLPNLCDLSHWGKTGGNPHPDAKGGIRIVFAGSNTHIKDVEAVEPAIAEVMRRYPHVSLVAFGCPVRWQANWWGRVHAVEWSPLPRYPDALASIKAHIGICPLKMDERFSSGKSPIKFFEYTLAGAAVVAADLPPYRQQHMGGVTLASTPEQWTEALVKLIEDEEYRRAKHADALQSVRDHWSWQHSPLAERWLEAMAWLGGVELMAK